MNMRPSKIQTAMAVAEAVSCASHDTETQVGAVLIKNDTGAIIATGFNGFVRGAPDDKLPTTRPEKYKYMQHAEQNIIFNCAKHGISMDNCYVVCTLSPCVTCMRALWQSGVTHVVVKDLYKDMDEIFKMEDLDIQMREISHGYHELLYTRKI